MDSKTLGIDRSMHDWFFKISWDFPEDLWVHQNLVQKLSYSIWKKRSRDPKWVVKYPPFLIENRQFFLINWNIFSKQYCFDAIFFSCFFFFKKGWTFLSYSREKNVFFSIFRFFFFKKPKIFSKRFAFKKYFLFFIVFIEK